MMSLLDQTVRYDLAESTSPPLTLDDLGPLPASIPLGYGTSAGSPDLRALIAAGCAVGPDQVLVTVGAAAALALLAQVTGPPGGEAVVAVPCFPSALGVVRATGVRVRTVPLTFDDGYRLPIARIVAATGPDTRLVSLASPQNPSGVTIPLSDLEELLAALGDQVTVLVDETYRAATYGPGPVPPSAASLSPRIVTCSSLSKAHGAAGLRIGWLTTTGTALYERLREAKFRTTVACSTVDEHLAAEVLRRAPEILAPRAARLREALDELTAWAAAHRVEMIQPSGGALCCLRLPVASDAFHQRLTALETRVAPGSWFGETDQVVRVGFGHLSPPDFTEALTRMAKALTAG